MRIQKSSQRQPLTWCKSVLYSNGSLLAIQVEIMQHTRGIKWNVRANTHAMMFILALAYLGMPEMSYNR